MINIIKRHNKLEDGSKTFDIKIIETYHSRPIGSVTLRAISERHADHLMETLRAAVVNYTNDTPATSEAE